MSFFKITYNPKYRFATLHNFGCTFRCGVCSYKLRSGNGGVPGQSYPRPDRFLSVDQMKRALPVGGGGQRATSWAASRPWPESFRKCSNSPRARSAETTLGHTNGSRLPLAHLDGANVGLKAWDESGPSPLYRPSAAANRR